MKCDKCNQDLMAKDPEFKTEMNTVTITMELTLLCVNPKCDIYCGPDMSNPVHIAKKIKKPIGGTSTDDV